MLKADQIELAVLTLVLECSDVAGPTFQLHSLEQAISRSIGPTSDREIIEALLSLYDDGFITLGRYQGRTLVSFDRSSGSRYFYYGNGFRCSANPKARRRQQELAHGNRNGIFISHFGPESPIAIHLKQFILAAMKPEVPVFVSSDYDSIPSGEWYRAILDGLRKADAIICLVSPISIERRWINFEAGFGFGAESEVIPLVWGQLDKGDIGMPLGQLQARALNDPGDIKAMMKALASRCRLSFNESLLDAFMRALPAKEAQIPWQCCNFAVAGTDRVVK